MSNSERIRGGSVKRDADSKVLFQETKTTSLYHGARFYELLQLFPRADVSNKLCTPFWDGDSEAIRTSHLTDTVYFARSPQIALAYPMIGRRCDEQKSQVFPAGLILETNDEKLKTRPIRVPEIELIHSPNELLFDQLRIADKSVPISTITGVKIVIYKNDLHQEKQYFHEMPKIAKSIQDNYPYIVVSTSLVDITVDTAKKIIQAT